MNGTSGVVRHSMSGARKVLSVSRSPRAKASYARRTTSRSSGDIAIAGGRLARPASGSQRRWDQDARAADQERAERETQRGDAEPKAHHPEHRGRALVFAGTRAVALRDHGGEGQAA